MERWEPQDDKNSRNFEIEPLEERVAPSTLAFGGGEMAYPLQGGQNGQLFFLGYDPVVSIART